MEAHEIGDRAYANMNGEKEGSIGEIKIQNYTSIIDSHVPKG